MLWVDAITSKEGGRPALAMLLRASGGEDKNNNEAVIRQLHVERGSPEEQQNRTHRRKHFWKPATMRCSYFGGWPVVGIASISVRYDTETSEHADAG